MKRILFLLLLTVSVYGQNPSRFAKIQITGNTNSGTATKVNVQEANGEVNTQTINTGFNKNFGLNTGDVVGANTLLNQYATTPVDWTATAFNSGNVVFYGGKQWIAKIATVAGDVPSVSSKWEEITFEALSNKTVTVDQTIIDGSTNAVSGNGVFDWLALKANLSGGNTFMGNQILPSSELQVGVSATNSPSIYFRSGGITAYGTGSTTNKSFELSQGAESQGGFNLGTNTVKMYMREGGLVGYSTPIRFNNPITSTGYVKEGGLASQFLKADGTVDSNSYALSSSVHNPVTLGTANGLSLATQQLSLGLASSGVTGALSGTDWNTFNNKQNALGFVPENVANKSNSYTVSSTTTYPNTKALVDGLATKENSFTKNTAFNKNFGITAGTVAEGNDSRINNGQTAFSWGNHVNGGYAFTTGSNINQSSFRTALGLGSNAYNSTAYLPLTGGTLTGMLNIDGVDSPKIFFQQNSSLISLVTNNFGIYGTGSKTDFNTYVYGNNPYGIWTNGVKRVTVGGDGSTTFTGTVTASSYTATSLPVFENNAAASSLAVGQFYRTSIGVLMVKF